MIVENMLLDGPFVALIFFSGNGRCMISKLAFPNQNHLPLTAHHIVAPVFVYIPV
jgi:hypothetical protein